MYKSKIVAGSSTENNLSGRRAKLWKALVRNCPEGLTWEETLWKDSVKNFCWKLLLILIMVKVRGLGVTLCGHGLREGRRTWMRQALFCIHPSVFLWYMVSSLWSVVRRRGYCLGIVSRILALFGKYNRISWYQGNLARFIQQFCSNYRLVFNWE